MEKQIYKNKIKWWDTLSTEEKENIINQTLDIDLSSLFNFVEEIKKPKKIKIKIEPIDDKIPLISSDTPEEERIKIKMVGEEALRKGEVGIFVFAGGQSTRLEYTAPKGTFSITPIKKKSLFQLHAEKIYSLCKKYNTQLIWYVMTSISTTEQIVNFFLKNNFFSLKEENVIFLEQASLPAISFDGKLIMQAKDKIFMSPDGHGGAVELIKKEMSNLKRKNLKYLFLFQVDNAFTKIADPFFIGHHIITGADISIKAIKRTDPEQKLGIFAYVNDKISIIEYSDHLAKEKMKETNKEGELIYKFGNAGMYVVSLDFIEREEFKLPYHIAIKKVPFLDDSGNLVELSQIAEPNGIKFEKFFFDIIPYAKKVAIMEIDEEEFHPLKNKTGKYSPTTVREALINMYSRWLIAAGVEVPKNKKIIIEISPTFALDKEEFIEKFNKKNFKIFDRIYIS